MLELDKIYNMDCLDGMKLLEDNSVDLIVTDPPYGVQYKNWDDEIPPQKFIDECFRICKKSILMFGGARTDVIKQIMNYNKNPERIIIWYTPFSLNSTGKNGMMFKWHPIYCWKLDKSRKITRDVITINGEGQHSWNHPATKPIKLIKILIESFSDESNIIIDPFIGSGTTAVACKHLNRHFIGFEINKEYYDISLRRLLNVPERLENWIT